MQKDFRMEDTMLEMVIGGVTEKKESNNVVDAAKKAGSVIKDLIKKQLNLLR